MREREREEGRAHGGREGRQGRAGPGRTGLGLARSGCGSKTRGAQDHGSETNRELKSERGKTDARLNTTSDKTNMFRHDATPTDRKLAFSFLRLAIESWQTFDFSTLAIK
jgi:hypothetical protein